MNLYHLQNRSNQELTSEQEIVDILKHGKFVVISMCKDNEPYIITLSYGYDKDTKSLYFHTAKKGLKLDFINANPHVCATIIEDGGYVQDECEHNYRTVVFYGNMSIVNDIDMKKHGMKVLLNHLEGKKTIIEEKMLKSDGYYPKMEVLKLDIVQIHGKAGK